MRKLVVVAVLVAVLVSWGMAFAFQNEPEGFRGLEWGDPPTPAMKFISKLNDWMKLYRKSSDKLELGDAQFYTIIYQFYTPSNTTDKRLLGVGLYFKDKENFELLKTICTVKFGEPDKTGFYELSWAGLIATAILTYDSIDKDGFLLLGSTPIFKQYTQEKEKQQAEEAEKDW